MFRYLAIFCAIFACSCASTPRGRAVQFGQVTKEVVDGGAKVVQAYLEYKYSECRHLESSGRSALEKCLGPVASNPDEIDSVFEAVRIAQLSLYLAVSSQSSYTEIQQARKNLEFTVIRLVDLIRAIRADRETKQEVTS